MKNLNKPSVIFPHAPFTLPGESIASWVIRLCGSHGYGFVTVKKLVKVKVKHDDWDEGIDHQSTLRLLEAAGLQYEEFFNEKLDTAILRECGVTLYSRSTLQGPTYGFCPLCFAEDEVPYLRWRWRYKNFNKCTKHHRNLLTGCPHCSARIDSSRPILRDVPSEEFIPNLGYCKTCAQPMYVQIQEEETTFKHPWELSRDWVRMVNPHDKNSVRRWLNSGRMETFSWRLRFAPPAEIKPVYKERETGLKQYRCLSGYGRGKVAKALGIVRSEMRRQREEDLLAAQDVEPDK